MLDKAIKPALRKGWPVWAIFSILCLAPGAVEFFSKEAEGKSGYSFVGHATWTTTAGFLVFLAMAVGTAIWDRWKPTVAWNADKVDGKITMPRAGLNYPENIDFSGTISGKLPANSHLWLLRRFDVGGALHVDAEMKVEGETWHGRGHVGGNPGDKRIFELWIVGEDSRRYFLQIKANVEALKKKCDIAGLGGPTWWELKSAITADNVLSDAKYLADVMIFRK